FGGWYPDSSHFVVSIAEPGRAASLWSVPVRGSRAEKLAEIEGLQGAGIVSPDGMYIAYARETSAIGAHEIWLMGPRGESPHRLLTAEYKSGFAMLAWSPAGTRLAYAYLRPVGDDLEVSIRSCGLRGENQTTIRKERALSAFAWVAPDRLLYARSTRGGA